MMVKWSCGVDTCSFLVLSEMLVLWVTVACLACCSNPSLGCKIGKEEVFEAGKETEESRSKLEVDEGGDGINDGINDGLDGLDDGIEGSD
jgi:hypothetical protein